MDLHLEDKVAIVTGASQGLGRYIAGGLAAEGCHVAICARREEVLREVGSEIEDAHGVDVLAIPCDLTEPEAGDDLVQQTVDHFRRVDVLVNNVGGNRRGTFDQLSDQDWDDLLDLNFRSHQRCSRAVIPHMREAGAGSIIFISSIFGREVGGAGLSLYNTTKSALISMAKIMAQELAGEKIRVNVVAPGSIRFPGGSWDRRVKEKPEEMREFVAQNLPIGRFGRADEIADVVAFLASERASLVTGACLNVDGGQSRSLI